MNVDSLSAALSHIGNLVISITKKNQNSSVQEINEIFHLFGGEAECFFHQSVLSQLEWCSSTADSRPSTSSSVASNSSSNSAAGNSPAAVVKEKDLVSTQGQLNWSGNNGPILVSVIQQLATIIPSSRFYSSLAVAVSNSASSAKNQKAGWVAGVCRLLKLTKVQEISLCLHLSQSFSSEVRTQAISVLKAKLPELIKNHTDTERSSREFGELSTELLHSLLTHSIQSCKDNPSVVLPEIQTELVEVLQKAFPKSQAPLVLVPFLHSDSGNPESKLNLDISVIMAKNLMENSLPDLIVELGYGFCSSLEECRCSLANIGAHAITSAAVARAVGVMARTYSSAIHTEQLSIQSLSDPCTLWNEREKNAAPSTGSNPNSNTSCSEGPMTWNVEIFAKALAEVNPSLNASEVVFKLDHKGFLVKDKQGLVIVVTAIRCLLHHQGLRLEHFPMEALYRKWKNTEEQLQFLSQILASPDVFYLLDHPCHLVPTDNLKALSELDNKEVAVWKSLQLSEVLLVIAEAGYYTAVKEIFKFPINHCPDVFTLALVQISLPFTLLRQELLGSLVPVFLGNHPNAAVVLNQAWQAQNSQAAVRQTVMHSMAEWYMMMENDQTRLSRILDVAQDLKALSLLLNAQPFQFVIDLACLAYRREFLKLDKWLTDKIRDHGEQFVSALVKFLQRRCPQLIGGKEELMPKAAQLPPETTTTILICLQACAMNLSQELQEAVLTMVQNCAVISRPRQISLGEGLTGITGSLGSLNLGVPSSSTIFPSQGSVSLSLGGLGSLAATPGSPARPIGPASQPTSQSPLSSLIPSLQMANPHMNVVGSQLASTHPSSSMSSALPPTLRSQNVQPTGNTARQMDFSQIFEISPSVSKDVEDEANSYFQRIYNHPPHPTLLIEEVLEMLKRFHESDNKREREVYACMLKNLFEEYRYFPTYPNKELITTAKLFGGIIEQGLVEYMALGVALRFVVEALQRPFGSNMYYFGIVALDRFKSRLKEYPRYCQHLMAIEHFNEFPPHLKEYVKYGTQSQEPPHKPTGNVLPITMNFSPTTQTGTVVVAKTMPSAATTTAASTVSHIPALSAVGGKPTIAATNIDTLLVATEKEEKVVTPPEHIQDKLAFIFNNLSQVNLQQKREELKEVVKDEYWPWVAQYLVMKRVSIENNFHTLYALFLDQLNMPSLTAMVTQETLRNIKVLLHSDKSSDNFSDKSLLKNLGHWLGMLTLGKNKPILHMDIDMKSLLIEAYKKGLQELQYVVPFVAKVMESCAKSRVFQHPNPWTMGIMNVLAELHREPDMKLHLKFEIELLCNKLDISVEDLKPSGVLKNQEKLRNIKPQLSQPTERNSGLQGIYSAEREYDSMVALRNENLIHRANESIIDLGMAPQNSSAGATPTPTMPTRAPTPIHTIPNPALLEPRFVYSEINISSSRRGFENLTVTVPQAGSLGTNEQLKQLVRQAVETTVQDIINLVIDRSIKIAITTADHIIKKDFALDPDESRMRAAAHHMVRNLSAAMAMITSRDLLGTHITKNIKHGLLLGCARATPQQIEQIEHLAASIAQENVGIACAFIQKTAAEQAVLEMDKRLAPDFEARKQARATNKHYYDHMVLNFQAERMPESIRLKVGRVTSQQMAVYEEFARNIPGFLPITEQESLTLAKPIPVNSPYVSEETNLFLFMMERVPAEIDHTIQSLTTVAPMSPLLALLNGLVERIILCRTSRDTQSVQMLLRKTVENLFEGLRELTGEPELHQYLLRFRDIHILILKSMADHRSYRLAWTSKQIVKIWSELREDIKFNLDVMDWLLRSNLLNPGMLDEYLVRLLEDLRSSSYTPLIFIMRFIQVYLIDDASSGIVSEADLPFTLDGLMRLCQMRQAPEDLVTLMEALRMKHDMFNTERLTVGSGLQMGMTSNSLMSNNTSNVHTTSSLHFHTGVNQARDFQDPPGLQEKTEMLLREWIAMYHTPNAGQGSSSAFQPFVKQMNVHGILKTDDIITRFFRICITLCREMCVRIIAEHGSPNSISTYVRNKCFQNLDAFVRLIALLVKQSGEPSNPTTKINLLNKVLGLVCGVMLHDIEQNGTEFHQLPYHRILIMLFLELNAPETILESINLPVLMAFTQTLHLLRPAKCPGFAYAWLEMVSHRVFIGRMLAITSKQKGWAMYSTLLTDLFKFLAPFLRNAELAKPLTMLYKGTLRVLLVLLHDFPEFLCEYHYIFCDVIPPNCIQMRNLILSAFPRNMRLPDPFTPNLKVDRLQEISISPKIHVNVGSLIQPTEFKKNLDSYLKNRTPVTFLSEMRTFLQVSSEPGVRYNIPVMNALVLYVGMQAIAQIQSKGATPSTATIAHSAHMDIFQNLAVDLDTEGRYLFLNAIANQLRYPNSHTHYFSCTLLYLFAEANTEAIQEQITRVLLERLIVNRPHPWGLLITFIDLIKNPSFWSHEFVKCAPEIEKLFESVARSCMVPKVSSPREGEA